MVGRLIAVVVAGALAGAALGYLAGVAERTDFGSRLLLYEMSRAFTHWWIWPLLLGSIFFLWLGVRFGKRP